ncbi:hypothetical protein [Nocardia sp. bgisy134]|uniref:hypothetical protein n=1 Tax=Nocardia sp. bgisy134 TaxID=3413789 RepID=UPI003D70428E
MSTAVWVIIVVIAIVVVAAVVAFLVWPMLRRQRLRRTFGPEYDRTIEESEDRKAAERELSERERRHAKLRLRELSDDEKRVYTTRWVEVQERFIDDPSGALTEADRLVTTIMSERGYPTENYEQQIADLSVEHAAPLGHYRAAHEIVTRPAESEVSTEDRRTAIVHYRELFQDLVGVGGQENKDVKS